MWNKVLTFNFFFQKRSRIEKKNEFKMSSTHFNLSVFCRYLLATLILVLAVSTVCPVKSAPVSDSMPQEVRQFTGSHRSHPGHEEGRRQAVEQCVRGSERQALCEMCAKVTKSRLAYSMCCDDQTDGRDFCEVFLTWSFD